jgi:RNA polymerase sigma factor (sigma-70 family)
MKNNTAPSGSRRAERFRGSRCSVHMTARLWSQPAVILDLAAQRRAIYSFATLMNARDPEEPRMARHDEVFHTTHWTVVLTASEQSAPGSGEALARLCADYWYPLYAYIRRRGHKHEDAEDLTQEFFHRLMQKSYLDGITREGGRFRAFLLTALKRFLAKEWDRANAQKRGGGIAQLSLDSSPEERYRLEPADHLTPERLYERGWAFAVMDQVMQRLSDEYGKSGKAELFTRLHPLLTGSGKIGSHDEIGKVLGMSENAVKMAAHRLKKRWRELLLQEVARTVGSEDEIEAELRHLVSLVVAFGYSFDEGPEK